MEQTSELVKTFGAINSSFNGVTKIVSQRLNSDNCVLDFLKAKNNASNTQYEYTLNNYFYDVCYETGVLGIFQSLKMLCRYAINLIKNTNKEIVYSLKLIGGFYELENEFAYSKMLEIKFSINETEKFVFNDKKDIETFFIKSIYVLLIKLMLFLRWVDTQEYIPF